MNGKGFIVAIVSVGVALGGLMSGGFAMLHSDVQDLRGDVGDLQQSMLRLEVQLTERMARLEGRVDTLATLFAGQVNGDCNE